MAVLTSFAGWTFVQSVQYLFITIFGSLLAYTILNEAIRARARIANMQGPKGFPLIGNLWDIRVNAAEQYRKWATKFGDVYQIQLGNIPVVVINSATAAKTIIGQNQQALSSRPEFYTFHKVRPSKISSVCAAFCPKGKPLTLESRSSPTPRERRSALRRTRTRSSVGERARQQH